MGTWVVLVNFLLVIPFIVVNLLQCFLPFHFTHRSATPPTTNVVIIGTQPHLPHLRHPLLHLQLFVLFTLVATATAVYDPAVERTAVADYSYGHATSDPSSGVHTTKEETRLGDRTEGSYSVALADGRTQVVEYWVDGDSGYNAKVSYIGEAQHPETPVVKTVPQPAVLPQHDVALDVSDVIVPPAEVAVVQDPAVRFIPDSPDFRTGLPAVVTPPIVESRYATEVRLANEQRAFNNLDIINSQRHFIANNLDARANYASEYLYGQGGSPAFLGTNFGQNGQVFARLRSAPFDVSRGAGFNRFTQQSPLLNDVRGRAFAPVNGLQTVGAVNGYGVRNANSFRSTLFNAPRQNYGYQGF